jgi:hypothetical protein
MVRASTELRSGYRSQTDNVTQTVGQSDDLLLVQWDPNPATLKLTTLKEYVESMKPDSVKFFMLPELHAAWSIILRISKSSATKTMRCFIWSIR